MLNNKKIALQLFIISTLMIVFSIYYVQLEHKVYSWDYAGYWNLWNKIAVLLMDDPISAFKSLLNSVKKDDYNLLPVTLISFFHYLPIDNRVSYIISIVIFYFIPVVFLFRTIFFKITMKSDNLHSLIIFLLPATFVAFWTPILKGYPDIIGILMILFCLLVVCKTDFSRLSIKSAIILGIGLWSAFLFRRWYAYTIVSLYISLPVLNYFLFSKKINLRKVFITVLNFSISGLITIAFALFFQEELLKRVISTDYSHIYSAYQTSFIISLNTTLNRIGLLMFLFSILGVIISLFSNRKVKVFVLFVLFNLIFTFVLFTRTQMPGMHHNLVFALWFLFLCTFFIDWLYRYISINKKQKYIFFSIFSTSLLAIQFHSLLGIKFDSLFPNKSLPYSVGNYLEYLRLVDTIDKLVLPDKKITVLSSTSRLNDDMLRTLSNGKLNKNILQVAHVDLRDKINLSQYEAEYVIVTNPVQLHLNPSGQKVISIPVHSIVNKKNIGNAYAKLDIEFKLDNNIKAYIYKKAREFRNDELAEFLNEFYLSYPTWSNEYEKSILFSFLTAKIDKGEMGLARLLDRNSIIARSGKSKPTRLEWKLFTEKLKITSINSACNQNEPIVISYGNSNKMNKVLLSKGKSIIVDLSPYVGEISTILIDKERTIHCGEVKIEKYN